MKNDDGLISMLTVFATAVFIMVALVYKDCQNTDARVQSCIASCRERHTFWHGGAPGMHCPYSQRDDRVCVGDDGYAYFCIRSFRGVSAFPRHDDVDEWCAKSGPATVNDVRLAADGD